MNVIWTHKLSGALSLPTFDVTSLLTGDLCCVVTETDVHFMRLSNSVGTIENSPLIVYPNVNPSNYWWEKVTLGLGNIISTTLSSSSAIEETSLITIPNAKPCATGLYANFSGKVRLQTLEATDQWTTVYSNTDPEDVGYLQYNSAFNVWRQTKVSFVTTYPIKGLTEVPRTMNSIVGSDISHDGDFSPITVGINTVTWTISFYSTPWDGVDETITSVLVDSFVIDYASIGITGDWTNSQTRYHEPSKTVFIGFPTDNSGNGSIVIFRKENDVWTFKQRLLPNTSGWQFGYSATTSFDKNTIAHLINSGPTLKIDFYRRSSEGGSFVYVNQVSSWLERGSNSPPERAYVVCDTLYLTCPYNDYYGISYYERATGCIIIFTFTGSIYERTNVIQKAGYSQNHLSYLGFMAGRTGRTFFYANSTDNAFQSCQATWYRDHKADGTFFRENGTSYGPSHVWDTWPSGVNGWVLQVGDEADGPPTHQFFLYYGGSEKFYMYNFITATSYGSWGPEALKIYPGGWVIKPQETTDYYTGFYTYYPTWVSCTEAACGLVSTDTNRFDVRNYNKVDGFELDCIFNNNVDVRFMVSFDNRANWWEHNGGTYRIRPGFFNPYGSWTAAFTLSALNTWIKTIDLTDIDYIDITVVFPNKSQWLASYWNDGKSYKPGPSFRSLSLIEESDEFTKCCKPGLESIGIKSNSTGYSLSSNTEVSLTYISEGLDIPWSFSMAPLLLESNLAIRGSV